MNPELAAIGHVPSSFFRSLPRSAQEVQIRQSPVTDLIDGCQEMTIPNSADIKRYVLRQPWLLG
jgi:hypothetical protein